MATIVTRSGKGSPLTNNEVDANFNNLNSGKAELSGATFTGEIVANAGIALGDNDKATFGAGDDLQIYHDGSNSYIRDAGTGDLNLRGDGYVRVQSQTSGTSLAHFHADAEVALYYNNSNKLVTTNTGISVTGNIASSGKITVSDGGNTTVAAIRFNAGLGISNPATDQMNFITADVSRFVIAADGSLSTPTAGTSNVRFGVNAGNSIASGGDYNVVIGDEAGTALNTADKNVAVGYQALATETGGYLNIAIGAGALQNQNGGSYNVAVGHEAGNDITTGVQNTFIGALSGDATTDADYNVGVGIGSLGANTVGSKSTAIGTNALFTQTPSSAADMLNVGLGYHAGFAVTTGVQNTLLGGLCHDNLTTGDLNISVGYNNAPSGVGVDSEIVIGNSVTGAGTNTVRIGTAGGSATLGLDGSDTSWAAASDARLKKDVADSTAGLEFINDLRPVTFKWNAKNEVAEDLPQHDADSSDPIFGEGKAHHGFIAQEVKAVIDDHSDVLDGNNIWHEDPDGTQQLSQGNLVPMLVKAIQEQNALIEALTARITTLEG